ncbi:GNAT family N-acetyltransferase [Cyanobium sp. FGCU-52]|nr:GNAT family N-acetyltransferase [Cyanobium sp. FGCU52]
MAPEHLEDCVALDAAALGGLWSREQWWRELEEAGRPGVGLWLQGQLVAMACGWLIVDELHVTLVAVALERRRLGLGRQVLEALLRRGRAAGASRATLEVAASNAAARSLYAACGFREAGVRRGYYRNGDDALIQWVNLTAAEGFG